MVGTSSVRPFFYLHKINNMKGMYILKRKVSFAKYMSLIT